MAKTFKNIANICQEIVLDKELSQEEFAVMTNISAMQISNILREKNSIPPKHLYQFCDSTGVDYEIVREALIKDYVDYIDGEYYMDLQDALVK